jgi:hypothetical protein
MHRIKRFTRTIVGKVEKTQESITFAQANHAQPEPNAQVSGPANSGKLLVVGHETMFSQKVIDYALDMAKRMSYEIVAVNAAPLSCNAFKPFADSQKKLCDEFQQLSAENVRHFKQTAEQMEIPFSHVVKFSEPEKALEMIQQDYDHIEFVITDERPATSDDRVSETQRANQQVYVYSML